MGLETPKLQLQKDSTFTFLNRALKSNQQGQPLPSSFHNYLKHFPTLGSSHPHRYNPVFYYYQTLQQQKKTLANKASFVAHDTQVDPMNFLIRVNLMLQNSPQGIDLPLTMSSMKQLRPSFDRVIYFHGNQYLTGAPFLWGGYPHLDFFQWGNLFGVIKYEELADEKDLDANLLIHFEDLLDRNLEQCIENYHALQLQLVTPVKFPTQNILSVPAIIKQPTIIETPTEVVSNRWIPQLTLSVGKETDQDK